MRRGARWRFAIAFVGSSMAGGSLAGCSIGGEGDEPSPFDSAAIEVPLDPTVADGRSEAIVVIRGELGREFTLVAVDAVFSRPDDAALPTETTVFLAEDGLSGGSASVALTATSPGRAAIFLKAKRVASLREVVFESVALEVGAPLVSEIEPGRVKHRLCVGANSASGLVQISGDSGGQFAPALPKLSSEVPAGLDCPTGDSVLSYAEVGWSTTGGDERATIAYLSPTNQPLLTEVVALEGAAFPGYDLLAAPVAIANQVATVEVEVTYAELAGIGAGPAEGVGLTGLRFVPADGPVFLGSSSGNESATPTTSGDGAATLFFSLEGLTGSFTLFLTPTGGAVTALTQITVP